MSFPDSANCRALPSRHWEGAPEGFLIRFRLGKQRVGSQRMGLASAQTCQVLPHPWETLRNAFPCLRRDYDMSRVGTYLLFTEQESEAGKSSPDFGI